MRLFELDYEIVHVPVERSTTSFHRLPFGICGVRVWNHQVLLDAASVIVVSTSLECTFADTAIWTNPDVAGLRLAVCGDEEVEAWREVVLDDGRLLHHPRGEGMMSNNERERIKTMYSRTAHRDAFPGSSPAWPSKGAGT